MTVEKKIQVTLDEVLLDNLDRLATYERKSRSKLIEQACRLYVEARPLNAALETAYVAGYTRIPEESAVGQAQVSLTNRVLDRESW